MEETYFFRDGLNRGLIRFLPPGGRNLPTLYSVTYCIYIPGNRDFFFIIIVLFIMSANSQIRFGLQIVFLCLYITPPHCHHCANLSEDIELVKCLSDILCRVSKIKHILSIILYTIYGAVWFHFLCDDWENIPFVLLSSSNRTYEPLFRVRSWNNGVL